MWIYFGLEQSKHPVAKFEMHPSVDQLKIQPIHLNSVTFLDFSTLYSVLVSISEGRLRTASIAAHLYVPSLDDYYLVLHHNLYTKCTK